MIQAGRFAHCCSCEPATSMIARCPLDEIRTTFLGREDEAALVPCSGKNELSRQRCRFGSIGCEQPDWRDTRDSARRHGVRTAPVVPVREATEVARTGSARTHNARRAPGRVDEGGRDHPCRRLVGVTFCFGLLTQVGMLSGGGAGEDGQTQRCIGSYLPGALGFPSAPEPRSRCIRMICSPCQKVNSLNQASFPRTYAP